MDETKIVYYLDEQDTPYLIKLNKPIGSVTLKDFKNALNKHNYKFFFKSMDDDFGVVKEEVSDDDSKLPGCNGRVIAYLISTEGSVTASDTKSQHSISTSVDYTANTQANTSDGNINTPVATINTNTSDYNIEHGRNMVNSMDQHQNYRRSHRLREINDDTTETDSINSALKDLRLHRSSSRRHYNSFNHHLHKRNMKSNLMQQQQQYYKPYNHHYDASSVMSSELDATTFFDTENDDQFSSVTESTTMSSKRYGMHRKKRLKHKLPSQTFDSESSVNSSQTGSTISLNIVTVCLNLDAVNFLGISIVGQTNKGGDGGIYVGSIMKGGAVYQDGRIEPGDMILQVNDVSFEHLTNEDAVKVLREAVVKSGPIKLVVAKCWDPNPKGYFTVAKQEPIKPIDPSAWVAHTAAMTGTSGTMPPAMYQQHNGRFLPAAHSISTFGSTSSLTNSMTETETRYGNDQLNLTVDTDMETVVRAMSAPDSGLDIRDRNWLKITISNAFIGSDVVDWLFNHVEGFPDRRDARKYACNLLKYQFIRHAVNKMRFSEQCYYVFGDASITGGNGTLFTLNEESEDFDSVSEYDRDTLCSGIMGPMQPQHRAHMMPPPPPSYLTSSSSTSVSSCTGASTTSGIVSQTENNFRLYYQPHHHQQQTPNSLIDQQTGNHTYMTSGINSQYTSGVSIAQTNQNYSTPSVYSNNSGGSKAENKSTKSSENSSSGNASDMELISSKASQQHGRKHNKYTNDSSRASLSILSSFKNHLASFDEPTPRSLDKIPNELRLSKSSFRQAMRNEVYLDVV